MLNPEDRNAIDGLFERLDNVAGRSGPRDVEAETLIRERLRDAPAAPYYMAQTILVQEHALRVAEQRITDLEAEVARRQSGGGFLGGLFGGEEPARHRPQPAPRGPWNRGDEGRQGQGGFLAGAAQTALGVTGGVLLGSAIASMLSGDVQAGEAAVEPLPDDTDAGGGDDFGDFDIGGDF